MSTPFGDDPTQLKYRTSAAGAVVLIFCVGLNVLGILVGDLTTEDRHKTIFGCVLMMLFVLVYTIKAIRAARTGMKSTRLSYSQWHLLALRNRRWSNLELAGRILAMVILLPIAMLVGGIVCHSLILK